jgi:hypothetical protein
VVQAGPSAFQTEEEILVFLLRLFRKKEEFVTRIVQTIDKPSR